MEVGDVVEVKVVGYDIPFRGCRLKVKIVGLDQTHKGVISHTDLFSPQELDTIHNTINNRIRKLLYKRFPVVREMHKQYPKGSIFDAKITSKNTYPSLIMKKKKVYESTIDYYKFKAI